MNFKFNGTVPCTALLQLVVSMTRLKSLAEQEPTDVTKGPSKKSYD